MNEYFSLLKEWCDKMIKLQVPDSFGIELSGGILCPACNIIHGRCADVIYPFVTMADITKDRKYLDAAIKVFDWSKENMARSDGSNVNDLNNGWKGVSIFYVVALAEALLRHGSIIPENEKKKWLVRAKEIADFMDKYMVPEKNTFNVNYRCGAAQMYALLSLLFPEEKERYLSLAKLNAEDSIRYITDENLLYGESSRVQSDNGCFDVDLGYEAEESIPALYSYADITGDDNVMEKVVKLSYEIANFYLPDGALDNSFGSRSAKWTYWGSRTSDGCQLAFCDLAKTDALFGEIAERNFQIYKKCTHDGLLCASPVYKSANEKPCVHHTFCHAKALAHMLDINFKHTEKVTLPAEKDVFFKYYSSMNSYIFNKNGFRCSIAAPRYVGQKIGLYPTGGSVSLLYHHKYGMIFAGSMPDYQRVEPENMQTSRHTVSRCNTLRLESCDNIRCTTDKDCFADIQKYENTYTVSGHLDNIPFTATYSFDENGFACQYVCEKNTKLCVPIVCSSDEKADIFGNQIIITKNDCKLIFNSESDIVLPYGTKRNFNPCGAFETLFIEIPLTNGKAAFTLSVK